jgi:DNA polymerase
VGDAAAAPAEAPLIFCDFETRNTSGCNLAKVGAWRYAADPATEVLVFGYRHGDTEHSWSPADGVRGPLAALAANPDARFACFGGFEPAVWQRLMVERHGFSPIPTERWVDLRAVCAYSALPRSLDKALKALGLPIGKDK